MIRQTGRLCLALLALGLGAPGAGAQGPGCGPILHGDASGTGSGGGQPVSAPRGVRVPSAVPVDGLGSGPGSCAGMLYERTIFNVDVLELTLRFDDATAGRLVTAAGRGRGQSGRDRMAREALSAPEVLVRTRFRRNISLDQFADGAEESIALAEAEGFVSPAVADETVSGMREVYGDFTQRGFLEDDVLWYRISGDELLIVVESGSGEILGEFRSHSPHVRGATLGGYLARGSDFREPLLRSLSGR